MNIRFSLLFRLFLIIIYFVWKSDAAEDTYQISVIQYIAGESRDEVLIIYKTEISLTNIIYKTDSTLPRNSFQNRTLVLTGDRYVITAKARFFYGWNQNSYFTIEYNGFIIFNEQLQDISHEWVINLKMLMDTSTVWKYTDKDLKDKQWMSTSYDDSSWQSASHSSFTKFQSTRRYYRYWNTLLTTDQYTLLVFKIYATSNIQFYIQDNLILDTMSVVYEEPSTDTSTDTTAYHAYTITVNLLSLHIILMIYPRLLFAFSMNSSINQTDIFGVVSFYETTTNRNMMLYSPLLMVNDNFDYNANVLVDHNKNTTLVIPMHTPGIEYPYITITYPDFTFVHINYLDILIPTPHLSLIQSLSLYGSNDYGNSWILLNSYSDLDYFDTDIHYLFSVLSNNRPYNMFKIVFLEVSGLDAVIMNQLDLSSSHIMSPEDLTYSYTYITHYIDNGVEIIRPVSTGYTNFTFPGAAAYNDTNIMVNPLSGVITWDPKRVVSFRLEISAINVITLKKFTTSLVLSSSYCDGDKIYHYVINKYSSATKGHEERVLMYDANNNAIYEAKSDDNNVFSHSFCIMSSTYSILLTDSVQSSWESDSYIEVNRVIQNITLPIMKTTLRDSYRSFIPFVLKSMIIPFSPSTYCNLNYTTISSDWYTDSFIPESTWTNCLSRDSITQYSYVSLFREEFMFSFSDTYSSVRLNLYAPSGIMIYINGRMFYYNNILDANVNPNTMILNDDLSYHQYSFILSIEFLKIGKNTIAFACIYSHTLSLPIENKMFYTFDYDSTTNTESLSYFMKEVDPSSLNYDNNDSELFNLPYYTFDETIFKKTIALSFETEYQFAFVNKYCISSKTASGTVLPDSWSMQCCTNDHCTLVSSIYNVTWSSIHSKQCFYVQTHRSAIHNVVFNFTSIYSLESLSIKNIELFADSSNSTIFSQTLEYSPSTQSVYIYGEITTMIPQTFFHSFVVLNGTLPNGLHMDPWSGYISGIPLSLSSSESFLIQAISDMNVVSTTIISIEVISCPTTMALITLKYINSGHLLNKDSSFSILDNNKKVIAKSNLLPDYSTLHFSYCLNQSFYQLAMYDSLGKGWGLAHIEVYFQDVILSDTYMPYSTDVYYTSIILNSVIHVSSLQWSYKSGNDHKFSVDTLWTSLDYDDKSWSHSLISDIPMSNSITTYYRTILNLNEEDYYSGFKFMISLRGGCIVYMNGIPIHVFNLYRKQTTSLSYALQSYNETQVTGELIHTQFSSVSVINGNNILAIEIHRGLLNSSVIPFSITMQRIMDKTFQMNDASLTVSHSCSLPSCTSDILTDSNTLSYYQIRNSCENVTLTVEYPPHYYTYMNYYSITTSASCNVYHPSSWILEGRLDDGITYDQLNTQIGIEYSVYQNERHFFYIPPSTYSAYRLTFTKCDSNQLSNEYGEHSCPYEDNFRLSEFFITQSRITRYCEAIEDWVVAIPNSITSMKCPSIYTGYMNRLCNSNCIYESVDMSGCIPKKPEFFSYSTSLLYLYAQVTMNSIYPSVDTLDLRYSVTPSLPEGIYLDTITGQIRGMPAHHQNLQIYTIVARNDQGSINTTITILIEDEKNKYTCQVEGLWSQTLPEMTAIQPCVYPYTGEQMRMCLTGYPPTWAAVVSNCILISEVVNVTYLQTTYALVIGQNVSIIPTVFGVVNTWSITPSLETYNLTFHMGTIIGMPSKELDKIKFEIEAIGTVSKEVILYISISNEVCPSNGEWPLTSPGDTASIACTKDANGIAYEGSITRYCHKNPVQWGSVLFNCKYPQPIVTYSPPYIISIQSQSIQSIPTCRGYCKSWLLFGTLPEGIEFNTQTGIFKGTPTSDVDTHNVIIQASNPDSSVLVTISLFSQINRCPAIDSYPSTSVNTTIHISCKDPLQEGHMQRTCLITFPPIWSDEINHCTYKTPVVTYPVQSLVVYINETLVGMVPTTLNHISFFTINPSLPNGLIFDQTTGKIGGIPSKLSSVTEYIITASNKDTYCRTSIKLAVIPHTCATIDNWPSTEASEYAYKYCDNTIYQYQRRYCNYSTLKTVWNDVESQLCPLYSVNKDSELPDYYSIIIQFSFSIKNMTSIYLTPFSLYILQSFFYEEFSHISISPEDLIISSIADIDNCENTNLSCIIVTMKIFTTTDIQNILNDYILQGFKDAYYQYLISSLSYFSFTTISINPQDITIIDNIPILFNTLITIAVLLVFVLILWIIIKCLCNHYKVNKQINKQNMRKKAGYYMFDETRPLVVQ